MTVITIACVVYISLLDFAAARAKMLLLKSKPWNLNLLGWAGLKRAEFLSSYMWMYTTMLVFCLFCFFGTQLQNVTWRMCRLILCIASIPPLANWRNIWLTNLYILAFRHPINVLCSVPSVSLRSWKLILSRVAPRKARVGMFLWFLWLHHSWWGCGSCTVASKCLSFRPDVHLSYYFTSAFLPSPFTPTCDCDQGCDAFKAGRGRVFSIVLKRCWRFLLPSETPPPLMNM